MKKFAIILSTLLLSAAIISGCSDNNAQADPENANQNNPEVNPSENTQEPATESLPDYKELYLETVNELNSRYEDVEWTYGLADIDGDGTPELMACYPATVSLYTVSEGKLYTVMEETGYGFAGNNGYYYVPGKNVIYNSNYEMAGAIVYENFCKINESHQLENYHNRPLYTSFWKDANGDGLPDDNEITDTPTYHYGNDEITEEAYTELYPESISGLELLYGEMSFEEITAELGK